MKVKTVFRRIRLDYLLYLIVFVTAASVLWVGLCATDRELGFDTETATQLVNTWEISWDGQTLETTLPGTIQNPNGARITMRTVLQPTEPFGNSILFFSRQSRVVVFMDGEQLWDSGATVTTPFSFSYGSFWNSVRLPEQWAGKELCIEMTPQFKSEAVANYLPTVYLGTKASFLYKIVKDGLFNVLFCLAVFVLGIYDMLNGIFHIHHTKSKQLFYLGAFAVCLSLWMLLEGRVIQLVSGNLALNVMLMNACFSLMPVLAVRFFLTYESIGKRKYMQVIYALGLLLFAVMNASVILGLCYFFQVQLWVQIYAVIALVGLFIHAVKSRKQVKQPNEKRLDYGIYILLLSTVLELAHFYLISRAQSGVMLRIGLGAFICYLGISIIQDRHRLRADDIERQMLSMMAYTDGLTHMENRFAFEEKMERLRSETSSRVWILIADINNLKVVNDNFGHAMGDQAIRQVAKLLQQTFGDPAACYRIGGDEFCVIAVDVSVEQMETCVGQFEQLIRALKTEYPLTVSLGAAENAATEIDATFRLADERMYQRKCEMKQ